jgi:hypothetical protein
LRHWKAVYEKAMPRIQITLPTPVLESLERWAKARGQATASCAAVALEIAIRQAEEKGEIPPKEKVNMSEIQEAS